MALISCSNCGNKISDKAKKCVHCGSMAMNQKKNLLISVSLFPLGFLGILLGSWSEPYDHSGIWLLFTISGSLIVAISLFLGFSYFSSKK